MAVHDGWARRTPYELSLPDLERARDLFGDLRDRASAEELADPGRFLVSPAAVGLLEELHGDEEPERLREKGVLLFHAFHFWAAGERLYLLGTGLVRQLLAGPPLPRWGGGLPARAGYVQLPWHLVWTDPGEGGIPESVDGLFWSAPEGAGELSLLLAAGLRPDRPGFSVVPLLPAPLPEAPDWPELRGREEGGDFTSALPGAELEGLYQLRTAGEVLKLAARALAWLERHPGGEPLRSAEAGPPAASRLPYRRIELD